MPAIARIEAGHYRIPLPVVLTDSTHGAMDAFELITCRIRDADGAEGMGYTYTVGRNGGAVHDILAREIAEVVAGSDADLIEALWQKIWWALHYGGRGGPAVLAQSAFDIALWDLRPGVRGRRCGGCSAGMTRACPAMRAASTSSSPCPTCCGRPMATSPAASAPSR